MQLFPFKSLSKKHKSIKSFLNKCIFLFFLSFDSQNVFMWIYVRIS